MLTHLLGTKGKRLRPALVFLIANLFDSETEKFIPLAAAVELLHTATLVHDDMVDGADTRRGRPTLNVLVGSRAAVLAGDYLFARSAAFAAEAKNLRVMSTFAEVLMDICDGELRQLYGNGLRLISRQEYYRRIEQKTAALFRATTEMAAVLSGASEDDVQALKAYGYHLGIAFQVMDDILDFVGGEHELGKPVGNDLRQGTVTLPVIRLAEMLPDEPAIIRLRLGSADEADLNAIIQTVQSSGCVGQVRQEAEAHVGRAIDELAGLPSVSARQALEHLAGFSLSRTS